MTDTLDLDALEAAAKNGWPLNQDEALTLIAQARRAYRIPSRVEVARALHASYEQRARDKGMFGGTILGGPALEDCSSSLRASFYEDAEVVLSLMQQGVVNV